MNIKDYKIEKQEDGEYAVLSPFGATVFFVVQSPTVVKFYSKESLTVNGIEYSLKGWGRKQQYGNLNVWYAHEYGHDFLRRATTGAQGTEKAQSVVRDFAFGIIERILENPEANETAERIVLNESLQATVSAINAAKDELAALEAREAIIRKGIKEKAGLCGYHRQYYENKTCELPDKHKGDHWRRSGF